MIKVPVIVGPTSSGKTTLALFLASTLSNDLAKSFKLISADSRQIYKLLNIGTGKIPVDYKFNIKKHLNSYNFNGIDVWGYDLVNIDQNFSAVDYVKLAQNKMLQILRSNTLPIVVGGTGFYVDLLTGYKTLNYSFTLDNSIEDYLKAQSNLQLKAHLKSMNADVYNNIDLNNPARVFNALKRELYIKNNLSINNNPLLNEEFSNNFEFVYIGLNCADRSFLYQRVDYWVEQIFNNGVIQETQDLIKKGFEDTACLNGLIYKDIKAYLQNNLSLEQARKRVESSLHAYIRRQLTWFKKNPNIKWFDIADKNLSNNVLNYVKYNIYG